MKGPRRIDRPEPGFYRMRLVRRGPWVPAVIFLPCPMDPYTAEPMERSRFLLASVDGNEPSREQVERVWIGGHPITAADYRYLRADHDWCRQYEPEAPEANPKKSIDLRELPPITP